MRVRGRCCRSPTPTPRSLLFLAPIAAVAPACDTLQASAELITAPGVTFEVWRNGAWHKDPCLRVVAGAVAADDGGAWGPGAGAALRTLGTH